MTHGTPDNDHDLRERFRAARRVDTERAPSFPSLMPHASATPVRTAKPKRLVLVASASAVAAGAIALAAIWVASPLADPDRPDLSSIARDSAAWTPHSRPDAIASSPPPSLMPQRGPAASRFESPAPVHPPSSAAPVGTAQNQERPLVAAPSPRAVLAETVEVTARPTPVDLDRAAKTLAALGYINSAPTPSGETAPNEYGSYGNVAALAPGVEDSGGDGSPNLHGSRSRDFKAMTRGPLTSPAARRAPGGSARVGAPAPAIDPGLGEMPGNTESYQPLDENDFLAVTDNPLSTFSIDVDTASYANVRRFLQGGGLPPRDAVRIEELVNYFRYDYPAPVGDAPFEATVEVGECPWNPDHRLARIGLKGRELQRGASPGSNLVFLIDVSGSMSDRDKLPLLKSALALLVEQLTGRDQVSIVVYAGSSGVVLPPTSGDAKDEILDAIQRLEAGGSTNGGAGMTLAYRIARENLVPGGVNRVILATDGDFNVGVTSRGELLRLIEHDAENGIFLTALGFGYGNLKDDTLEHLADRGNGNYAYIDRLAEARKVLVEEMTGTLVTIAKDVKIQVEFNPLEVGAYRLIGYENRMLQKEDFNDDRKDAGEIGAGHTVTALYELVPPERAGDLRPVDPLKYQSAPTPTRAAEAGELFTLRVRYKDPEGQASRLLSFPVDDEGLDLAAASPDFKFAAAVAEFGLLLRGSAASGEASFDSAEKLGAEGLGADEKGRRSELLDLIREARRLSAESGGS